MKDLHSHVLFNIDDGPTSYQDSVKILNELYQSGVTEMVVTPHYIINSSYNANNDAKKKLLDKLSGESKIKLYLGNEVYLDYDIAYYIDLDKISTINGSKYVLVELSMTNDNEDAIDMVRDLISSGYYVIIAHPERYHMDINELQKFINMGCLFQGNITSLLNKYGENAKNKLELLLKNDMIHVMGSDTHRSGNIDLNKAIKIIESIVGVDKANEIINTNFDKIINNKKINEI